MQQFRVDSLGAVLPSRHQAPLGQDLGSAWSCEELQLPSTHCCCTTKQRQTGALGSTCTSGGSVCSPLTWCLCFCCAVGHSRAGALQDHHQQLLQGSTWHHCEHSAAPSSPGVTCGTGHLLQPAHARCACLSHQHHCSALPGRMLQPAPAHQKFPLLKPGLGTAELHTWHSLILAPASCATCMQCLVSAASCGSRCKACLPGWLKTVAAICALASRLLSSSSGDHCLFPLPGCVRCDRPGELQQREAVAQ